MKMDKETLQAIKTVLTMIDAAEGLLDQYECPVAEWAEFENAINKLQDVIFEHGGFNT